LILDVGCVAPLIYTYPYLILFIPSQKTGDVELGRISTALRISHFDSIDPEVEGTVHPIKSKT